VLGAREQELGGELQERISNCCGPLVFITALSATSAICRDRHRPARRQG
jgi:hypothetical protein